MTRRFHLEKMCGGALAVVVWALCTMLSGCQGEVILKYSTLHEASLRGDLQDVKNHLRKGVAVNAGSTESGASPLLFAALGGEMQIAQFLVEHGADVNYADTTGNTPLHAAAYAGDGDMVRYLIGQKADVNVNSSGFKGGGAEALECSGTPLHFAAATASLDIMAALLDAGALTAQLDAEGFSLVQLASGLKESSIAGSKKEFLGALEALPGGPPLPQSGKAREEVERLRRETESRNRIEAVRLLLERSTSFSPFLLLQAVDAHNEALTELLLQYGANPDVTDREGFTALHRAIFAPSPDIMKVLLMYGADPGRRSDKNFKATPLHHAALRDDPAFAEALLCAGAEINAICQHENETPLDWADNQPDVQAFLRENGGFSGPEWHGLPTKRFIMTPSRYSSVNIDAGRLIENPEYKPIAPVRTEPVWKELPPLPDRKSAELVRNPFDPSDWEIVSDQEIRIEPRKRIDTGVIVEKGDRLDFVFSGKSCPFRLKNGDGSFRVITPSPEKKSHSTNMDDYGFFTIHGHEDSGVIRMIHRRNPRAASEWKTLSEQEIRIEPGERINTGVTVEKGDRLDFVFSEKSCPFRLKNGDGSFRVITPSPEKTEHTTSMNGSGDFYVFGHESSGVIQMVHRRRK